MGYDPNEALLLRLGCDTIHSNRGISAMARQKKTGNAPADRQELLRSRLELIRQRHRALIVQAREMIAADFDHEFGDAFDEMEDLDQVEMGDLVEAEMV